MKDVLLIGNPNVGKTTIFNLLTGGKNHTGNWSGKTVESAKGYFTIEDEKFCIVDLPGIYSLNPYSPDEEVSSNYFLETKSDVVIVICDSTLLERNLFLFLQLKELVSNLIMVLTLTDISEKNGISIDTDLLSQLLDATIVNLNGKTGAGIENLKIAIKDELNVSRNVFSKEDISYEKKIEALHLQAKNIADKVLTKSDTNASNFDEKFDKILLKKSTGIPILLFILTIIFWLTIVATNVPSKILASLFLEMEKRIYTFFTIINTPFWLKDMLVNGGFKTMSWVVSVMLPPMSVFFPLFTFLEDFGLLPRIAFNLDGLFRKCFSNGKQSLTMLMGFGCNAVGVTSTEIFKHKNSKLIAIITNNFIPCNGRFPTIILLISIFLSSNAFMTILILFGFLILSFLITFIVSFVLGKTIYPTENEDFIIELPSYRVPNIKNIIKVSFFSRTLMVLGRAISFSLPCGILIWFLQNFSIGGNSLFILLGEFFDPFGIAIGLNGVIITAFLLGIPANEIVLPIVFMAYTGASSLVSLEHFSTVTNLLESNGFTKITAICMILMTFNHFPCGTTLLTIKKETNSTMFTIFSAVLPTVIGVFLCFIVNLIFG